MARPMTPRQRAALKKAQIASANKRRGTGKKKTLKQRYQKGESGPGAIHRRRQAQWNSGRQSDKAKVLYKSGSQGGAAIHAISYGRDKLDKKMKKKGVSAKNRKRVQRAVATAVVAGGAAYAIHSANKSSNGAVGRAANKGLHNVASKKRARTAAKAKTRSHANSRGLGTKKANAKARKKSYVKPKGRKKVYKVTTAKKARKTTTRRKTARRR